MRSLMQFGGMGPVGSSRIGLASLARSETQYLEEFLRGIEEPQQSCNMLRLCCRSSQASCHSVAALLLLWFVKLQQSSNIERFNPRQIRWLLWFVNPISRP